MLADTGTKVVHNPLANTILGSGMPPLIDMLAEQADVEVLISTTTLTSQNLARKAYPERCVFYFPYDLVPAVKRMLGLLRPDLVVITETELWPNFIDHTTRVLQKPLILINGRISKRSYAGYKNIKAIIQPALRQVTHFYTQSQADADHARAADGGSGRRVGTVGTHAYTAPRHSSTGRPAAMSSSTRFCSRSSSSERLRAVMSTTSPT